jgi:hypothetical protein
MWGHVFLAKFIVCTISCDFARPSSRHVTISPIHQVATSPLHLFANVPFRHSTIPPSHHCDDCTIPPFHYIHSAYQPFRQPTIWAFHHSTTCVNFGIPPFRHSTTPPFRQPNPFNRSKTSQHPVISPFILFAFAFSPFHHSAI